MRGKIKIAVLETGHILAGSLASGDRWLERIARHLPPKYYFQVLVPEIGATHWEKSDSKVRCHLLPSSPFDNRANPLFIFLSYLLRIWPALKVLKTLSSIKMVYSSTDILPDILPAYFWKKRHPRLLWMAQVHHLLPPPANRPGNFLVNFSALLMQKISLYCLKNIADLILVNNSHLYTQLVKMGFNQQRLKVLGAGIEYVRISQAKILPDTPLYHAIFLGRLRKTKGIFDLVPIWKGVVKSIPQATLAVIGEGEREIKRLLAKQIQESGLSDQIELLGFIQDDKLFSLLKKARVFLFCDYEAGWGVAVAEAMACGLPVVGYDIGVLGSVYQRGFVKVPLGDHQRFSTEVARLLRDEEKRIRLAREAQQIATQLDWSNTGQEFAQILETIFKNR